MRVRLQAVLVASAAVGLVGCHVQPGLAEMVGVRIGAPPESPWGKPQRRMLPETPTAYVAKAQFKPAIDGKLDEPAWKQATVLSIPRTLDGSAPASQPTAAMLLRDAGALYVGIRCAEPAMDRLRPGSTGRDVEIWTSDSVEVFLGAGGSYWHFGVNPAGGIYDGQARNTSWNVPFGCAVARDQKHWSVELSLPLDKLVGKAEVPAEWTANFNRTRYAGGAVEEYAWSPTYSDDSHVPARFGKLLLTEPPAEQPPKAGQAVQAEALQVLEVSSGRAVLRFDLSAVPKGAKVARAELRLFRAEPTGRGDEDALARVEVYGLDRPMEPEAQARRGSNRETPRLEASPTGHPLALRGPWQDRLDATPAVKAWTDRGLPHGDFFIKAAPPLRLEGSCLEVAYERDAARPPPLPGQKDLPKQPTGLKAFCRSGQTFITFDDREDTFGDRPVTWGQIRDYLRDADPKRQIRYRVYRHDKPINAQSIAQAQLLAEVSPLSGFNVNSWSLERLIDQTVFANEDHGELGKYGPFSGWNMQSPEGGRLIIPRFAIEDNKPLPAGKGLYVHSATAEEKAYYAVTAVADGLENLSDFAPANSLTEPLAEAVASWRPVEQTAGSPFGFDFRGARHFYVTWAAPPLAPRPMYFNWSVLVPLEAKQACPVELYFHSPGYSYARPPVKFLERSIQICPHDFPFSGWYGYNDAADTLKGLADGAVRPHTIRRVEAFLKWAEGVFPIDPERIVAVGGDGAALMALHRPELFAYVLTTGFEARQLDPKSAGAYVAAWGPPCPQIKDESGRSDWAWGELDVLLCGRRLPNVVAKDQPPPQEDASAPGMKQELPLFVCRSYSWGRDPAYGHGRGRFYYALQATRHPLHAHWAWGGNLTAPEKYSGLWQGLDLTRSTPVPAITYSSADQEGEGSGHCNSGYTWRDVKEGPDSLELSILGPESTFELTPRRLSKFEVRPGQQLRWQATYEEVPHWARREKPGPQSGLVTADANGLITLKGLRLATGYRLVVRIEPAIGAK